MVIASVAKHNKVEDLHVAQITTQVEKARQRGEYVMKRWNEAHVGLKHESAIRPRVEHIVRDDVIMRVGTMHPDDRAGLAATMKDLFGIQ
jgi:uncharacterized membrane protein